MGHTEPWESAVKCALRELEEEAGLARESDHLIGFWALEQVHPYFMASLDAIVMSPRFAAEVTSDWEPKINHEHTKARWVSKETFERLPVWFPEHTRRGLFYKANWSEPQHNTNRQTGVSKLKLKEMGSRYLFIVLYLWLEKHLARGDYHRRHETAAKEGVRPTHA